MSRHIVACILAGGEGTRLFPLTAHRAKPAVRFGGSYRLIDFPLSNCVNSDIRQVLVFPQYKALSLERHLRRGWSFLSAELDEYVVSIPPQQRLGRMWYRGTADAVYQNLWTLERIAPAYVLILGGDHVYQMDYRRLLQWHQEHRAAVTVATVPVPRQQANQFGIVLADPSGMVTSFVEKPEDVGILPAGLSSVLASMGIYLFTFNVLRSVLLEDARQRSTHDFGRDILPGMVGHDRVAAFPFLEGIRREPAYWRDVGMLDAYWEAHMDLIGPHPRFRLHQPQWPLRTAQAQAPPTIFCASAGVSSRGEGGVTNSLIAQGCMLEEGRVDRSILSPGVRIEAEAEVQESVLFDGVHIGRGAKVRRAILDRGVVVQSGTRIGYDLTADGERFTVSDGGITVVGYAPLADPGGPRRSNATSSPAIARQGAACQSLALSQGPFTG